MDVSLSLNNISVNYGKQLALNNVSLSFYNGKITSILGPSGSGKTTLLRLIAGLIDSYSGDLSFSQRDAKVGLVFQNYALFPNMTAYKNIAYGLKAEKVKDNIIHEEISAIADALNISDILDKPPSQLSGGQQQRVAIARTLVTRPTILLMDEPFSNIDDNLRSLCRETIQNINKVYNTTIIIATHIIDNALTMSDQLLLLNNGSVEQYDNPKEMISHPKTSFVVDYFRFYNKISCELANILNLNGNDSWYIRNNDIYIRPIDGEQNVENIIGIIEKIDYYGNYCMISLSINSSRIFVIDVHNDFDVGDKVNVIVKKEKIVSVN